MKRRRGNCAICTARKRNGVGHTEEFCAYPGGPFDGRVSDAIAAARAKKSKTAKPTTQQAPKPTTQQAPKPTTQQLATVDTNAMGLDINQLLADARADAASITEAVKETVREDMLPPITDKAERAIGSYQMQQIQMERLTQQLKQQQRQIDLLRGFAQEDDNRLRDLEDNDNRDHHHLVSGSSSSGRMVSGSSSSA